MNNYIISYTKINNMKLVIWKVPDVLTIIKSIDDEIRSGYEIKADEDWTGQSALLDCKLDLKIEFIDRDVFGLLEINYKLPITKYLKSTICSIICGEESVEREIVVKKNYTVQANVWQYLISFKTSGITSNPSIFLLNSGHLCLKLQFIFNEPDAQLSNELENMLTYSLFSDVIMKSAEGIEFKVHKGVLASRSAVLKAHFEHNTTECLTNIVISPFELHVLKEVLTFIYTDKTPRIDEIPEKLLVAADYYQLSSLKSLCEKAIPKKLTVENAVEILQLAELYSANVLKQSTLQFIKNGRARVITNTEGWEQCKSVELLKSIYEYITSDYEA